LQSLQEYINIHKGQVYQNYFVNLSPQAINNKTFKQIISKLVLPKTVKLNQKKDLNPHKLQNRYQVGLTRNKQEAKIKIWLKICNFAKMTLLKIVMQQFIICT
jgi:hypothetical protein